MVRKVKDNGQNGNRDPSSNLNEFQVDLTAYRLVVRSSTVQHVLHMEVLDEWVMQRKPFLKSNLKQSRL